MAFHLPPNAHPDVAKALVDCRRAFWSVAIFSGAVNLLMLSGPLYMLQIYDRVLSSRSVPTLVALSVFLIGAYAFQAVFDLIRSRLVVRLAALLDQDLSATVHAAVIRLGLWSRTPAEAHQPVRDLDQIRAFLTGAGPIAIVDLPWMPIFLVLCFLIHPVLGGLALLGAAILVGITVLTERASRAPAGALARDAGLRASIIEADRRNSESAAAMGMASALTRRWATVNGRYIAAIGQASDITGSYGSLSKVTRLLLQSMILGVGAYLAIRQELSPGAMIAASIMVGRALAPIETAITHWRSFVLARQSVRQLSDTLVRTKVARAGTALPKPERMLEVENVVVAAPGAHRPIVANVRFRVMAGEALGIVGPSGAGKTSLVRCLVGIWPPMRGTIRLDGATLDQWDREELGRHIGFVSQSLHLFDGTIAQNIARMATAPDSEQVIEAARAAGAHDMILRMPAGYDTRIGESGEELSAGQRQRLALARALYGNPFLIVLDEPNANLDSEGEAALQFAIRNAKERKAIVIIIAHRPSSLTHCDKVLFLANGVQQAFGPREEMLQRFGARPVPAVGAGNLKVVRETDGGRE